MSDRPKDKPAQIKQTIFDRSQVGGNVTISGDINQNYINKSRERPRKEQSLLKAVHDEVENRLTGSLHNAVLLSLGKKDQPDQINSPSDREIKLRGAKATALISNDETIAQVFDSPGIKGKLLLLGQPGSGKTTMLLDLAKALIAKAENEVDYPIPVLFNLSRWQDEKKSIREWMVEELKSKYGSGFDSKLGEKWIREKILLPLLDGLDEVAPKLQEKCAQQINRFLSEEVPHYAVVCSRIEEYQNYETRLELNGAIYLKELSNEQIQKYLVDVERQELWSLLTRNSELLTLVRAPLLLSMFVLAYPKDQTEQWQQIQDQRLYLLDRYTEKMLHQNIKSHAYSQNEPPKPQQTRFWLKWLAKQMGDQTEFLIEEMQPSMLSSGQQIVYRLLLSLFFGLLTGLIFILIDGWRGALIGMFIGGGLVLVQDFKIEPVEELKWSWTEFINRGLFLRLIGGLFLGLLFSPIGGSFAIIGGLLAGLSAGILHGMQFALSGHSIDQKVQANQGIKSSRANFVRLGILLGLGGGILGGLMFGLGSGTVSGALRAVLIVGLSSGIFGGMANGGFACIQHFVLRQVLHKSNRIPWDYARFLDYCTELSLLQRVGGRYRFVHKLLQEHLANMPATASK